MLIKTGSSQKYRLILILFFVISLYPAVSFSQSISLNSELEQDEIWLGDSVRLTITLQGSEQSFEPKLLIPGVTIVNLGGGKRSSESVTNINGKVTRNVNLTFVYTLSLTPDRAGELTIPPIAIDVEGQHLQTKQLSLQVNQPEFSEDYHLLLNPEVKNSYVSEEFGMTVSFLFNSSIRELAVRIPGLDQFNYTDSNDTKCGEKYQIEINGMPFVFIRNDQKYKGVEYAGISTRLFLKAKTSGKVDLGSSTAVFEAAAGSEKVRDFFGRVQEQPVYKTVVIPSDSRIVDILPFPEEDRPDSFTGFSGKVSVEVSAGPVKVHIGDPITLNITFKGLNNPDIEAPDLKPLLGSNFGLPDTRSYDKVDGNSKTITQTIRVKDQETTEIPALNFSYFDPGSENYRTISTNAIPLEVLETNILTSSDLEGGSQEENSNREKVLIEKKKKGIYYNFTGEKILANRKPLNKALLSSPLIWVFAALPPVSFAVFIFISILLPGIRQRIIRNRDLKAAFKAMSKRIKSMHADSPKEFLRQCNREINTLIQEYKVDCSNQNIQKNLNLLNNYLYGSDINSPENIRLFVDTLLESFKKEGAV